MTALPLLLACSGAPAPAVDDGTTTDNAPAVLTLSPDLGIDLDSMTRSESGIYTRDVTAGTGATVEAGSTVIVDYSAWLADGTLYEQRPDDQGFGSGEMVVGEITPTGLNEALIGMQVGGVRRIVLPPEHGYGLVGRPSNVPAGSTLVYEVRLRDIR